MATSPYGPSEQLNTPPTRRNLPTRSSRPRSARWRPSTSTSANVSAGLDALAEAPATPAELAERTRTNTRYAVEWLETQAVYGNLTVVDDGGGDRLQRRYAMPPGAAEVLTDRHSLNYLGALPQMMAAAGAQLDKLLAAYRDGGGVSWAELGDNARNSQAALNRPWFESALAPALASVPGSRLCSQQPGARIADIGCGAGWSSIALARAYPSADVLGVDVDEPSIQAANANAEAAGVADRATFRRRGRPNAVRASARLMLPSRSSAFTTCRARLTYWRRYTERSVPTDWW